MKIKKDSQAIAQRPAAGAALLSYMEFVLLVPATLLTSILSIVCLTAIYFIAPDFSAFTMDKMSTYGKEMHDRHAFLGSFLILGGPVSLVCATYLWWRVAWILRRSFRPAGLGILGWICRGMGIVLALFWDGLLFVFFMILSGW